MPRTSDGIYNVVDNDEHKRREASFKEATRYLKDNKVSFGKVTFGAGKGPYIVAFEDTMTREYCECNAREFKNINIADIKLEKIPLWDVGAKTPEQINSLPKLDMAKHRANTLKAKEKAKEDRKAKRLAKG
jgi:hypothetical protein